MKNALFLIFSLLIIVIASCSLDEEERALTTFKLSYENKGTGCNSTSLKFTFLATEVDGNKQESYTVDRGERVQGGNLVFRDGDVLNIKVFVASSEDPLHEVNIPFIYANYTQEQLDANDNALDILYCHEEDRANITWTFLI